MNGMKISLITVTWTLNNSIVNQIISYQYPSVDHHAVAGYLMWRIKKVYELNDILLYSSVEKRIQWWSLSWCSVLLSFWCVLFAFFLVECAHIEYVHITYCSAVAHASLNHFISFSFLFVWGKKRNRSGKILMSWISIVLLLYLYHKSCFLSLPIV